MVEWNGGMEKWNVFYRVKGHCCFKKVTVGGLIISAGPEGPE